MSISESRVNRRKECPFRRDEQGRDMSQLSVNIQLGEHFSALPRRLREAASSSLRRELDQALTRAVRDLPQALRASAVSTLPRRGGLGELTARTPIKISHITSGSSVSVRVTASSRRGLSDPARLDRGSVRHPLFGRRSRWYTETVSPGWWTKPIEAVTTKARSEIEQAMDTVVHQIS